MANSQIEGDKIKKKYARNTNAKILLMLRWICARLHAVASHRSYSQISITGSSIKFYQFFAVQLEQGTYIYSTFLTSIRFRICRSCGEKSTAHFHGLRIKLTVKLQPMLWHHRFSRKMLLKTFYQWQYIHIYIGLGGSRGSNHTHTHTPRAVARQR